MAGQVEQMAHLQFSTAEVAVIVGVVESDITREPLATAFMRGRLQAQADVRQAILTAAKQGSTPAQKEFQAMAEKSEPDEG
jgi:hypothetical protein